MILLYILPLIVNLFFLFWLCCLDTASLGKWIHILTVLTMFFPGLNVITCILCIWTMATSNVDSNEFIHCKKFWSWLLGK